MSRSLAKRCSRLTAAGASLTLMVFSLAAQAIDLSAKEDSATVQGYGKSASLPISYWDHALLKFDLGSAPDQVESAQLRVYFNDSDNVAVSVYEHADDAWDEAAQSPRKEAPNSPLINQKTTSGQGYFEIDVTDYVNSEINSDGVASFELMTQLGSWRPIASRESSYPPTLSLVAGDTVPKILQSLEISPTSSTVFVGESVTFQAVGQDQFGSEFATQPTWSVSGGGSISSEGTYTAAFVGGPFMVTAVDGDISDQTVVTVVERPTVNQLPEASFTSSETSGTVPLDVQFTSTSSDSDGEIVNWNWDFGDGNTSVSSSPVHTFSSAGQHSVKLTVTDDLGATATSSQFISVTLPGNTGGPGQNTTLAPIQDTSTVSGYGTAQRLPVSYFDHSVFKFDISTLDGTPSSAIFRVFYQGEADITVDVFTQSSDNWNESTAPPRQLGSVELIDSVLSPAADYIEFDVSEYVETIDGDVVSFKVATSSSSWNSVLSRESSHPPELIIASAPTEPATLTSFSVNPKTAIVNAGESLSLGVVALDQYGNGFDVTPVWTVSGSGSVSPDGLFIASDTAGSALVSATSGDKTASATIAVVIPEPPNSPPVALLTRSVASGIAPLTVSLASTSTDADGTIVSTAWDFGDGSNSNQPSTTHVYTAPGSYTVTLAVADDDGDTNATTTSIIVLAPPEKTPPSASIEASSTSGTAPLNIDFTAVYSDSDGIVEDVQWTFGDGSVSDELFPAHVYSEAGTYTVTLKVTDDDGLSAISTTTVTVSALVPENVAPTAAMTTSVDNGVAPLTVQFDSTSTDSDGTITHYAWDFGDGNNSVLPSPSHTYAQAGSYTATLTVTDDAGDAASATKIIAVGEPVSGPAKTSALTAIQDNSTVSGYGQAQRLPASYYDHSVFKFDISKLEGSPESATFRVYFSGEADIVVNAFSHLSDNWDEATPPPRQMTAGELLDSVLSPAADYIEFDVSEYLASSEDDFISFKVTTDSGTWSGVLSRESATPPELVIETTPTEPAVLTTFSVNPQSVNISIGESQSFSVVALDQYGQSLEENPTWSVSGGGSISPAGVFQSDNTEGTFTVTAAAQNKVATASVAVTRPEPPNVAPTAAFTSSANSGEAPLTVTFGSTSSDSDGSIASLAWDFGTGSTSTADAPSHVFTAAGTYTVKLTVIDDDGDSAFTTNTITVSAPPEKIPPSVSIEVSPKSGFVPLPVQFTADYADADGSVESVMWTFGDGATSTELFPGHVYTAPGTYTATLTVTDNDGLTATASEVITGTPLVPDNAAPTAAITVNIDTGPAPLDVEFTSTSSDSDGSIVGYAWDFGDGNNSTAETTTHTFTQPGTYTASLIVTDDAGDTARAEHIVTVTQSGTSGEPQSATLEPIQDTATTGAYGTAQSLPVSFWDHSVFKFDISELAGAPYSGILRIFYGGDEGIALNVYPHASEGWDETTNPTRYFDDTNPIATIQSPDNNYAEFDLTEYLGDIVGQVELVSFKLTTGSSSWNRLLSRESGTPPQLVVELTPPQPPYLASLAVTPAEIELIEGDSLQFSAQGLDQYGQPFDAATTWQINSGGNMGDQGLLTATIEGGPYIITATSGNVRGTSTVTVKPPPYIPPAVVISEIHYQPLGGAEFEFVELANTSDAAVSLSQYSLTGAVQFVFPETATLAAGERLLIAKEGANYASLETTTVYEWTSGSLPDDSGTVSLLDVEDNEVSSVSWSADGGWPGVGSSDGTSLELVDIGLDASEANNWANGDAAGGSPGQPYNLKLLEEVTIHANKHFLMYENGEPFFWLADTQWDIVHKATRELADLVLDDRKEKGFTAIQIPMMFHWSTDDPNAYGELPGEPGNWNEAYWAHVDYLIDGIIARGMHPLILPAWGNLSGGVDNFFNQEQAIEYGSWLANRFTDRDGIIWVVGGDRTEASDCCGITDAIARGIKSIDPDRLVTFHSLYQSRKESHTDAEWLDFSGFQTGHHNCDDGSEFTLVNRYLQNEWNATPTRPVVNMEPRYENIQCHGNPFSAYETRLSAYWSVFAGSFGISYGESKLWYFIKYGNNSGPIDQNALLNSLAATFSGQAQHLKNLMLSRPFFGRVPDNALVGNVGGIGASRGSGYIMVYSGNGSSFNVDTSSLAGTEVQPWWFNPRDGSTEKLATFTAGGTRSFDPPDSPADGNDWVLVLDDAARGFNAPGQSQ